ncbi:MAG: hypothetical protein ACK456_16620 [Pseudanabaenaceae cyanobacterium]
MVHYILLQRSSRQFASGNSSVALGDVNWFSQLIVSRLCQLLVTVGSRYSEHLLNDFLLTTNNRAL